MICRSFLLTARNLIFDRFHDFALYCGFMVGLVYVDRCVGSFRVASPPSLLLGSFRRLGLLSSGAPCSATLRHLRPSRRPGWATAGPPAPRSNPPSLRLVHFRCRPPIVLCYRPLLSFGLRSPRCPPEHIRLLYYVTCDGQYECRDFHKRRIMCPL